MDCVEISYQHNEEMVPEVSKETIGSNTFKTNDLCVIVGYTRNGGRQLSETIIQIEEEYFSNTILKKYEATLSHAGNQCEDNTQVMDAITKKQLLEEHVIELDKEKLGVEDSQKE